MTTALVWLFAVLLGGRLRLRPQRRRPGHLAAAHEPAGEAAHRRRLPSWPIRRAALPPVGGSAEPQQIAMWCDDLARAVRSGSTLSAAIGEVEPPDTCATVVEQIRLAQRRGVALRRACDIDSGRPHLDLALTVIRACATNGGPAAEPLSRAAATLRGRAADAAERRTQSAQARLSAIVMTILPVCMLAVLLVTSASVRTVVGTPPGLAVIAVGVGLNALGWRWMSRLIEGGHR